MWRPGTDDLEDGEDLEYDPSAYDCLHAFQLEWPCLRCAHLMLERLPSSYQLLGSHLPRHSCDILRDELGDCRTQFPHSMYLVAGSQADSAGSNVINVVRLTQLFKTRRDIDDSDSEASESDSEEEAGRAPVLQCRQIAHHGGVNRIRSQPQAPNLVATWAETGHVQVWDIKPQLLALHGDTAAASASAKVARVPPRQVFSGHTTEGYALDWSSVAEGRLLSGDCAGAVHLWEPAEGGRWVVSTDTYSGHGGASVEDLQWSPNEAGVFASCGVDGAVCIWDARQRAKPALRAAAHDSDVNVLSWNRMAPAMLASADDEGCFRIWDLRHFAAGGFVASFNYHSAAVTSIEWAQFDSSTLATSSADNSVAVWDLAVERDAEEEVAAMQQAGNNALPPAELPPQLMFVHQGQRDVKELHWHPQVPGLLCTTAASGFNVWKPENQGNLEAAA